MTHTSTCANDESDCQGCVYLSRASASDTLSTQTPLYYLRARRSSSRLRGCCGSPCCCLGAGCCAAALLLDLPADTTAAAAGLLLVAAATGGFGAGLKALLLTGPVAAELKRTGLNTGGSCAGTCTGCAGLRCCAGKAVLCDAPVLLPSESVFAPGRPPATARRGAAPAAADATADGVAAADCCGAALLRSSSVRCCGAAAGAVLLGTAGCCGGALLRSLSTKPDARPCPRALTDGMDCAISAARRAEAVCTALAS